MDDYKKKKKSGGGNSGVREDIIFQTVGYVLLRTIWKAMEHESWKPVKLNTRCVFAQKKDGVISVLLCFGDKVI